METNGNTLSDSGQPSFDLPPAVKSEGISEVSGQQQREPASRVRRDSKHLHATRHGVLSRFPLETLARRGENIRQLRRIEKLLRQELKPKGIVAKLIFDHLWCSFLRSLLIARTEADLLASAEQRADEAPQLRELDVPTLVYGPSRQGIAFPAT